MSCAPKWKTCWGKWFPQIKPSRASTATSSLFPKKMAASAPFSISDMLWASTHEGGSLLSGSLSNLDEPPLDATRGSPRHGIHMGGCNVQYWLAILLASSELSALLLNIFFLTVSLLRVTFYAYYLNLCSPGHTNFELQCNKLYFIRLLCGIWPMESCCALLQMPTHPVLPYYM